MISLKHLFAAGLVSICHTAVTAQTSIGPSEINAAGGSVDAGGNTYEYAIGQVVASKTFSSPALVVTPGVLQPNFVNTAGVAGAPIKAGELQVFPSPAEHTVFLQPAFGTAGILQWNLYASDGRLVLGNSMKLSSGNEKQQVDVSALSAGQYTLQVSWNADGVQYISGYKIQKIR